MDPNHLKAYQLAMQDVDDNHELWDFYHRCRLLQDHISAMTDHSAYDEYRLLNVSD
jgi:dGTPase